MTALLDTTSTDDAAPETVRAAWGRRAVALAVDVLPAVGVLATMAVLGFSVPAGEWPRWVFAAVFAGTLVAAVVNRVVLPTVTGWTLGRALVGVAVVGQDGDPVGIVRLTLREVAHVLDTASLFIGWLWPLWDTRRRTFADMLARTEVRPVDPPHRDMRRLVAKVLIGAAVLSAAGVGLAYGVVYRHEQAVDSARAELAAQGPGIVEQMLSYGADTMVDDFARAQSLTTDGYRDQLIAQQQAVQNAGATTNEYWAVNSAVLSNPPVTPDRGSMLLAMQGQRGNTAQDQKFITATVQVEFEKASTGQWRVASLTVLKRPAMSQGGGQ